MTYDCPQCGCETEQLHEGYCEPCRDENQRVLNEHNTSYDHWQGLADWQRSQRIKDAINA